MTTAARTREVPRDAWTEALNRFTTQHEGWLVSSDVLDLELGAQPEIRHLPLIGVSADRTIGDGTIAISVGLPDGTHFIHVIDDVRRLHIKGTNNGAGAALLIESADGTRTVLHLHGVPVSSTVLATP